MRRRLAACGFVLLAGVLLGCGGGMQAAPLTGAEAQFVKGQKNLKHKRYLEAVTHFQRVVSNYPGSSLVADAQYYLAEAYFRSKDFVNALFEYQRLIDGYPYSKWIEDAQFKIAESHFKQMRRVELDQKETYEALDYFRRFVEDNPQSPLVAKAHERIADCRDRLAQRQYMNARLYHKQGYLKAATITYEDLLRNFPDTAWYYRALMRLGEVSYRQGDMEQARVYWEEALQDSTDEKFNKKVKDRMKKLGE